MSINQTKQRHESWQDQRHILDKEILTKELLLKMANVFNVELNKTLNLSDEQKVKIEDLRKNIENLIEKMSAYASPAIKLALLKLKELDSGWFEVLANNVNILNNRRNKEIYDSIRELIKLFKDLREIKNWWGDENQVLNKTAVLDSGNEEEVTSVDSIVESLDILDDEQTEEINLEQSNELESMIQTFKKHKDQIELILNTEASELSWNQLAIFNYIKYNLVSDSYDKLVSDLNSQEEFEFNSNKGAYLDLVALLEGSKEDSDLVTEESLAKNEDIDAFQKIIERIEQDKEIIESILAEDSENLFKEEKEVLDYLNENEINSYEDLSDWLSRYKENPKNPDPDWNWQFDWNHLVELLDKAKKEKEAKAKAQEVEKIVKALGEHKDQIELIMNTEASELSWNQLVIFKYLKNYFNTDSYDKLVLDLNSQEHSEFISNKEVYLDFVKLCDKAKKEASLDTSEEKAKKIELLRIRQLKNKILEQLKIKEIKEAIDWLLSKEAWVDKEYENNFERYVDNLIAFINKSNNFNNYPDLLLAIEHDIVNWDNLKKINSNLTIIENELNLLKTAKEEAKTNNIGLRAKFNTLWSKFSWIWKWLWNKQGENWIKIPKPLLQSIWIWIAWWVGTSLAPSLLGLWIWAIGTFSALSLWTLWWVLWWAYYYFYKKNKKEIEREKENKKNTESELRKKDIASVGEYFTWKYEDEKKISNDKLAERHKDMILYTRKQMWDDANVYNMTEEEYEKFMAEEKQNKWKVPDENGWQSNQWSNWSWLNEEENNEQENEIIINIEWNFNKAENVLRDEGVIDSQWSYKLWDKKVNIVMAKNLKNNTLLIGRIKELQLKAKNQWWEVIVSYNN